MAPRVVVTGLGIVSPIGIGVSSAWQRILQGSSGIRNLMPEHHVAGVESKVAAYVPDEELQQELSFPRNDDIKKQLKNLSRSTIFSLIAAHEALRDSQLIDDDIETKQDSTFRKNWRDKCGIAIGMGMVDMMDIYENGVQLLGPIMDHGPGSKKVGYKKISPHFITRMLLNMGAGHVSIRHSIKGPNHCASTACTTGAHSIGDAFNFIRLNHAPIMLCGSAEAPINAISMAGFSRIRALSTKYNNEPTQASRPFDMDRCGFVMGEGSGILVLESLDHAKARKAPKIYAEILGYGLSGDAHHLTAPSPQGCGAFGSMKQAIEMANLAEKAYVTHVNAHATSTPLGDEIECDAISRLLNHHVIVTSCKGSIGHLLGAAGSVESIFSILSCYHSIIPPTLNLLNPIKTNGQVELCKSATKWNPIDGKRRILVKNSFGFGGTNASLVIAEP